MTRNGTQKDSEDRHEQQESCQIVKFERIVTDGANIGDVGKVGKVKHRDGLTKVVKEHLRRTIGDTFMKQCKRTGVTLDAVEDEELSERYTDNVMVMEIPWSAVSHAREEELQDFQDLCVRES